MVTSNPTPLKSRTQDLTGKTFGRLTVLAFAGYRGKKAYWYCCCCCGKETIVAAHDLKRGHTAGCGCTKGTDKRVHGRSKTPEYVAWTNMLHRCQNPDDQDYHSYGGRGITVCHRWLTFVNFYADIGDRPSPKHTLERIDNGRDYSPENCRWATRAEQASNRRTSHRLTFQGKTLTAAQWSRLLGINYGTICQRIRCGLPVEQILRCR